MSTTFCHLTIEIETVCRKYLDTRIKPGENIAENTVITMHVYVNYGKKYICDSTSCGKSDEIFLYIIQLWCNIRVHSFAKKWTAKLLEKSKSHTKSIRKTLKK